MYATLKNRLTNGEPFKTATAIARINALANNLTITQEQADELTALANQNGITDEDTVEGRLSMVEGALFELTEIVSAVVTGETVTDDMVNGGENE